MLSYYLMCGTSAERNLHMKKVLPSGSGVVWGFQNLNWVFSCIYQLFFCISQTLISLVWVCLLCCLLCSSPGHQSEPFGSILEQMCVTKAIQDFPVSADTGLGQATGLERENDFSLSTYHFLWVIFWKWQTEHPWQSPTVHGAVKREFVWHGVSVERKELQGVLLCLCVLCRRVWQRRGGWGGTLVNKMSPVKVSIVFLHSVAESSQQCGVDGSSPVKWTREQGVCSSFLIIHRTQKCCILTTN